VAHAVAGDLLRSLPLKEGGSIQDGGMLRTLLHDSFKDAFPRQLSGHAFESGSGIRMLKDQWLLAPLVAHLLLEWLLEHLWRRPLLLLLLGLADHQVVLEEGWWGGSAEEREATLQLDAAAYTRLHSILGAGSSGSHQSDSSRIVSDAADCAGGLPEDSTPATCLRAKMSESVAQLADELCQDLGIDPARPPVCSMVQQALQLRLCRGGGAGEGGGGGEGGGC
jgi:hypothetical protein